MISISRSLGRDLRAAIRKLGTSRSATPPPIELMAGRGGLTIRSSGTDVSVSVHIPGRFPEARLLVPAAALADCESRDDQPIAFRAGRSGRIAVDWTEAGQPRNREYPTPASALPFPKPPIRFAPTSGELLQALDAAGRATAQDSASRYVLNGIQLRGSGEIVATDSKQLLLQGGFSFPWTGDVLVPRSDLFAILASIATGSVSVARTPTHVWIERGAWTVSLRIQEGTFPDARTLVARVKEAGTELVLDPVDRDLLLHQLPGLPGQKDDHRPVTLDLGNRAVVRAKGEADGRPVEVVLTRSDVTGKPVRAACDRTFLIAALKLGFTRIAIASSDRPIVCRDGARTYLFMSLTDDVIVPHARSAASKLTTTPRGPGRRVGLPALPVVTKPSLKPRPRPVPATRAEPGMFRSLIGRIGGLFGSGRR